MKRSITVISLSLVCASLLFYSLVQRQQANKFRLEAERQVELAEKAREEAERQREIAEDLQQQAELAQKLAQEQLEYSQQKVDSIMNGLK